MSCRESYEKKKTEWIQVKNIQQLTTIVICIDFTIYCHFFFPQHSIWNLHNESNHNSNKLQVQNKYGNDTKVCVCVINVLNWIDIVHWTWRIEWDVVSQWQFFKDSIFFFAIKFVLITLFYRILCSFFFVLCSLENSLFFK